MQSHTRCTAILSVLVLLAPPRLARAQPGSTTLTYRGSLQASGQPYTGTADLSFTLWNVLSDGTQIGSPVIAPGTTVRDGLFSVALDFGADSLRGEWFLQIAVRAPGWNGQGAEPPFTTLDSRQAIRPALSTIQTREIMVGTDLPCVDTGTTQPMQVGPTDYSADWKELYVEAPATTVKAAEVVRGNDSSRLDLSTITGFANTKNFVIDNTGGLTHFRWLNENLGVRSTPLVLDPYGNVGVGITGPPLAKLDIGGTPGVDGIRFPDGTVQTSASPLALGTPSRLARGYYNGSETSALNGFTVNRLGEGVYQILFDQPWNSAPTVVVTLANRFPGLVSAEPLGPSNSSLWTVRTFDRFGNPADTQFSLIAVGSVP